MFFVMNEKNVTFLDVLKMAKTFYRLFSQTFFSAAQITFLPTCSEILLQTCNSQPPSSQIGWKVSNVKIGRREKVVSIEKHLNRISFWILSISFHNTKTLFPQRLPKETFHLLWTWKISKKYLFFTFFRNLNVMAKTNLRHFNWDKKSK